MNITNDTFAIECIKGYKIPFKSIPPTSAFPQAELNASDTSWVVKLIDKMLDSGVVRSCSHTAGELISPIFLVPKADGSKRFILNLKKLNCYVDHEHFKVPSIWIKFFSAGFH